jgi:hypothetical protein
MRLLDLGRVAAHLQQRQHQRGEFMPHGQAGKAGAVVFAGAVDRERRRAVRPAACDSVTLMSLRIPAMS